MPKKAKKAAKSRQPRRPSTRRAQSAMGEDGMDQNTGKGSVDSSTARQSTESAGPQKGEFVMPPEVGDQDERADALPQQEEFWRPPTRFGSVPVEKEPLGWDRRRGFRKLFPQVLLPFQVVERITFGHPDLEPNRLFWGDNLHVMRQLPSESIDLIYIDPPFFSGRQYNVIFGDQNELRSFSDIWEGGMPGYLIWLNARLYEMKRLLKKTGSIYVHLDWHAAHYVKVELDKVFGVGVAQSTRAPGFRNEIIWHYYNRIPSGGKCWDRKTDSILFYTKSDRYFFEDQYEERDEVRKKLKQRKVAGHTVNDKDENGELVYLMLDKRKCDNVMRIPCIPPADQVQRIGYPTQKPEALLERIVRASSPPGGVIADFFCGGGTTPAMAQRLGRRWIACDQSRVAVAITADRLTRQAEGRLVGLDRVPDLTVEHWGVYETQRLSAMPPAQFRAFVLRCFGAVDEGNQPGIHGMKGAVPVWVGEPNPRKSVSAADVQDFANAIRRTLRYKQDNLRDGIMLAWAFRQEALDAAERLRRLEQTDVNFIRLDQVRVDSPRFREHVAALSTDHADYESFLTFVQPPRVEVGHKRIATRTYRFDVTETAVMNPGAKIINVQWDFDYGKRFSSTPGYSFVRGPKKEPELQVQYVFADGGTKRVACKVQDDMGGEGLWAAEIEVT